MERLTIYEYDQRNRDTIVECITKRNGIIVHWATLTDEKSRSSLLQNQEYLYSDLSMLFTSGDPLDSMLIPLDALLYALRSLNNSKIFLIVERQYSKQLVSLLYYSIEGALCLEEQLEIDGTGSENIVELEEERFLDVLDFVDKNLFGNKRFKKHLGEELAKYRLFNRIGEQPIFSLFICGTSGIGKTEVARLLHRALAPSEPMIKINFGNYSTHDALNSLIGSPRGYVGSSKGELTEKLMRSRSKVILIDEFEKAGKPVFNFFLQLLEEGKFTDSLGREYDLNKYIIVFTSNMPKERIPDYLPAELRSRFSYKCAFGLLTEEEKEAYVDFKGTQYLEKFKKKYPNRVTDLCVSDIVNIDVNKYQNIRDINSELRKQIAGNLYERIIG